MSRLLVGALVVALLPLAGCSSGPKPDPVAASFLAGWQRGDLTGAARLTDAPAAAGEALTAADRALAVTGRKLTLGRVTGGDTPTAAYAAALTLRGLGTWRYDGRLTMVKRDGRWLVHWSPADLHPQLAAGQRLARTRTLPERAPLLDRAGRPLVTPTEVVTVSIVPRRLTNRAGTLALLRRTLDVDPARVRALLAAARPDEAVPVITLRRSAYEKVRARLHDVPGLVFPTSTQPLPPSATFARPVIGRLGPATAEALAAAGPSYQAGDVVGLSGLQVAFQRRLAGTASGAVAVRDAAGTTVATLQQFPGTPPQPVRTTLELPTQRAAEHALAPLRHPAALVAVRPSDGALLAVANAPGASSFDRALVGHYPPGSTFKIVTTAALLGRGLGLDDPVPCPPTATVEGKRFRNFEGEAAGVVPFRRDFAISCNTAFVALGERLPNAALPAAARSFGIGSGWKLPLAAYDGSVPPPGSTVERAADAIGQGRVTASPVAMALVAAAVQNGSWRPPVLVTDPTQPAGSAPAPVAAAPALRGLMRDVVTKGTAADAFRGYRGAPVSGKTGTAEYGGGASPPTHAWFVGFRGDLAFAVVVEGGGAGGAVAAPVARAFLTALG